MCAVHSCVAFGSGCYNIDVTCMATALGSRFATRVTYRSSACIVTLGRPSTCPRTTSLELFPLLWSCGTMKVEENNSIWDWLSSFNVSDSTFALGIFNSYSGSNRNKSFLKTKLRKVLNTVYQHLQATLVFLHKDGFLYNRFCMFVNTKSWLVVK